jgi:nitroreductase
MQNGKELTMSVLEVMKKRCSIRKFEDRPIERDVMLKVLEAGRIAPSACNKQPWHFIVVQDQALKERIGGKWEAKAPAIIVICGDHQKSWRRQDGKDHCDIDVAIAVDHMTLAATDLGLGTCWVCWFDAFRCAQELKLPDQIEPMVLLPIGYPAETSDPERHSKARKPLDEIVSWDGFPQARKK